jgi:hypothetical protein
VGRWHRWLVESNFTIRCDFQFYNSLSVVVLLLLLLANCKIGSGVPWKRILDFVAVGTILRTILIFRCRKSELAKPTQSADEGRVA